MIPGYDAASTGRKSKNKLHYVKIKAFFAAKDTSNKVRGQPREKGKMQYLPGKGQLPGTYKKLLKVGNNTQKQ